ncbi:MAG: SRPBCC family protein [Mycobacterium sp.]
MESRHIGVWINRPADEVYRYAADPRHLPRWAAGLAHGEVTPAGDEWVAESPMGPVAIRFAPANEFGVLDHVVTLGGAEPVLNPLRVLPAGPDRCEVVFTLRRRGMSDAEYEADAEAVAADLATLKRLLESD